MTTAQPIPPPSALDLNERPLGEVLASMFSGEQLEERLQYCELALRNSYLVPASYTDRIREQAQEYLQRGSL